MSNYAEEDVSVCYRHPGRQSWVLCQRCGRTICPECQIQAPVGVQCPECVREASGAGPRWVPTSGPTNNVTAMRRTPTWQRWLKQVLLPDSGAPVVTWGLLASIVLLFIVNLFASNTIALWLAAFPQQPPWQIWRYFTSALVQLSILSLVLNTVFFLLIGPTIERLLGRARFATVLAAGAAGGSAAMLLAGNAAFGLSGAMFGMFAAYFVIIRSQGMPTTQFLVIMAINLVLTLVLSPSYIFMLIGGLIAGGGAAALFFYHRDKGTRNSKTPYWQIAGGVGVLILLAIVRTSLLG